MLSLRTFLCAGDDAGGQSRQALFLQEGLLESERVAVVLAALLPALVRLCWCGFEHVYT